MRLAIDEEAQGLACIAGGIVYVKVKFNSRAVKTGGKSRKLYLHAHTIPPATQATQVILQ